MLTKCPIAWGDIKSRHPNFRVLSRDGARVTRPSDPRCLSYKNSYRHKRCFPIGMSGGPFSNTRLKHFESQGPQLLGSGVLFRTSYGPWPSNQADCQRGRRHPAWCRGRAFAAFRGGHSRPQCLPRHPIDQEMRHPGTTGNSMSVFHTLLTHPPTANRPPPTHREDESTKCDQTALQTDRIQC